MPKLFGQRFCRDDTGCELPAHESIKLELLSGLRQGGLYLIAIRDASPLEAPNQGLVRSSVLPARRASVDFRGLGSGSRTQRKPR